MRDATKRHVNTVLYAFLFLFWLNTALATPSSQPFLLYSSIALTVYFAVAFIRYLVLKKTSKLRNEMNIEVNMTFDTDERVSVIRHRIFKSPWCVDRCKHDVTLIKKLAPYVWEGWDESAEAFDIFCECEMRKKTCSFGKFVV